VRGSTCIRHTQSSKVVRPLINRDRENPLWNQLLGLRVYRPKGGEWEIKKFLRMFWTDPKHSSGNNVRQKCT
jgi:hypothetical protein